MTASVLSVEQSLTISISQFECVCCCTDLMVCGRKRSALYAGVIMDTIRSDIVPKFDRFVHLKIPTKKEVLGKGGQVVFMRV